MDDQKLAIGRTTEVDTVLECGGRIAGVEVKASSTVTAYDFKGLRKLQQAVDTRFVAGIVTYDGETVVPFGPQLYAVPICCLWAATRPS